MSTVSRIKLAKPRFARGCPHAVDSSGSEVDDDQPDQRHADEQRAHVRQPGLKDELREEGVCDRDEQQRAEQEVGGELAFLHTACRIGAYKTSPIADCVRARELEDDTTLWTRVHLATDPCAAVAAVPPRAGLKPACDQMLVVRAELGPALATELL